MLRIFTDLRIDHLDLLQVFLDFFRGFVLEGGDVLTSGFNIPVNDFLLTLCLFKLAHERIDTVGKVRLLAFKLRELIPLFLVFPISCQDGLLLLDKLKGADGVFRCPRESLHIGSSFFLALFDASYFGALIIDLADIFVDSLELVSYTDDLQQRVRFFLVCRF